MSTAPSFDQYLVDYTVRNITTGDEEEIRVLELTAEELESFPAAVRSEIRALVEPIARAFAAGQPTTGWDVVQDRILDLLLPYISDSALYQSDYGAWEENVLNVADDKLADADKVRALRLLDNLPPEDIAHDVREALQTLVDAAVENWAEGYWADVPLTLTHGEAFDMLAGFVDSMRDMEDGPLSEPVFEQLPADT